MYQPRTQAADSSHDSREDWVEPGGRVERPAVLGGPLVLVDVVVWGARSPFREGHRRRVQDRLRPRASRPGVRRPALRW